MIRRRRCRHDSKPFLELQPVEPPQATRTRTRGAAGARDPRGGRKSAFPRPIASEKQSRIVLLAPLPEERKPAIGWPACNALIPRRAMIFSDISWGHREGRHTMQIALFQPDIPQNTGTILRLCACLDVSAHIIEPAGFPVSDRHFRRAGMD